MILAYIASACFLGCLLSVLTFVFLYILYFCVLVIIWRLVFLACLLSPCVLSECLCLYSLCVSLVFPVLFWQSLVPCLFCSVLLPVLSSQLPQLCFHVSCIWVQPCLQHSQTRQNDTTITDPHYHGEVCKGTKCVV